MEKIDELIQYAVKEGFIDQEAEYWTDEQKLAYYNEVERYENDFKEKILH